MKEILLILLVCCSSCDAQFWKRAIAPGPPTADEVSKGLKEALVQGTNKGTNLVSKVDGYFKNPEIKIPFPPDVKIVETKLRFLGMGKQVDDFVLSLNRAAEDAAKEASPIFVDAIQKMTIQDAAGILKATKYYADIIGYYNKVPFVQPVNPDLAGYATDMAIQGLFVMIAKEETLIRKDPVARTTDLLKKVFK